MSPFFRHSTSVSPRFLRRFPPILSGSFPFVFADNLFGDRLLNLDLFDKKLYEHQDAWYKSKTERYGVPLDSRHAWTKVHLSLFRSDCMN
jgi:hypothetical protein